MINFLSNFLLREMTVLCNVSYIQMNRYLMLSTYQLSFVLAESGAAAEINLHICQDFKILLMFYENIFHINPRFVHHVRFWLWKWGSNE